MPADQLDKTQRATYITDLDRALTLISGHFDSAWSVDHLQFGNADVLEGFTLLTYLAARHPQLNFGNTVLCHSFRNPALLAKMGATVQFLSGGRFILGLGAGWHEEEHRAYGYDFPTAGVRVEQLAETIYSQSDELVYNVIYTPTHFHYDEGNEKKPCNSQSNLINWAPKRPLPSPVRPRRGPRRVTKFIPFTWAT